MKILNKKISLKIKPSIEKLWEREYCVFTISSYELNKEKILEYGGAFFDLAIYIFKNQKLSHYRDMKVQEELNQLIFEKVSNNENYKNTIISDYINAGKFLEKSFEFIEKEESFPSSFIEDYCKNFGQLSTGTLLIQRCPDYLIKIGGHQDFLEYLIGLRKKFEYIFGGTFEKHLDILLKKIVKRGKLKNYKDLKYFTVSELIDYNNSGKIIKDLEERKKLTILLITPKQKEMFQLVSGDNAGAILKEIQKNEKSQKNERSVENGADVIRGLSVYGGKIQGQVQVIKDFTKLSKLKEGNILVVPSTLPKYENYYHKASAIVSDEGGMLSHVAIFCREFHKPGIAATKIATQVLKDGDLVEVDADNGVIKIIK